MRGGGGGGGGGGGAGGGGGGGGGGRTGERVKRDTLRHQTVEFSRVLINTYQ
jgi:hypothetical protein